MSPHHRLIIFLPFKPPFIMKQRQILWVGGCLLQKRSKAIANVLVLLSVFLMIGGCNPFPLFDRTTNVYGKVTDQVGQPIDSMAVIMLGHVRLSSGNVPIGQASTNSKGEYELVIDVPKRYAKVSAVIHSDYSSISNKYLEYEVFKDGVRHSCCTLVLGEKTNYDFVMLPK